MSNTLFVIAACSVIGVLITIFLGLFRRIGLDIVPDFALRMVFYDRKAFFNDHVIWNKLWLRFGVLAFAMMFGGVILAGLLGPIFHKSSSLPYMTLVTTVAYGYWTYRRGLPKESRVALDSESDSDPGFFFDTDKGVIQVKKPSRGIFISGGAGSGKTRSLIEPIIQQAGAANYTGLLYDFKFPTLAEEVAGSYSDSQVTLYYVNFIDLTRSHRVNPVNSTIITNASFAREAAVTILANLDFKGSQNRTFWIQSAEALLTGSIWYLRNNYPQYCTLPHAVSLILECDPKSLISTLQQDEEVRGIVASIASGSESQNQLAGVFATVQNYLSVINTPDIFWVMSGDDVPFDLNSPSSPGMLVIGNDPTLTNTFSPLISLIVSVALKRMNQPGRIGSVVILDEAPTLFIPKFHQIPATGRSNKIATVYAVQDIAQIEGAFGPQESETLISNLGNQFFGRTTNPKTAQRVTAIFGRQDVEYTTYSAGKGSSSAGSSSNTNASTSIQQRDRLEAQAVMRFEPGKFAGIIAEGNTNEFVDRFHQPISKAKPIEQFKTVTEEQKRFNFKQIKEEVRSIISPNVKPADTQKPQEDHSNKKSDSQAHDPGWETYA